MASFVIRFGKSRSKHYNTAVELAQTFSGYQFYDAQHIVEFDESTLDDFFKLLEMVGYWVSSSIFVNGTQTNMSSIEILQCYRRLLEADNGKDYCKTHNFGPYHEFPCRHIWTSRYHNDGLTDFGYMDDDRIFHVDKDKLRKKVLSESTHCLICPAFNLESIENAIESTPEVINPRAEFDWEYVHIYGQSRRHYAGVRQLTRKQLEYKNSVTLKKLKAKSEPAPPGKRGIWGKIKEMFSAPETKDAPVVSNITIAPSMNKITSKNARAQGIKGASWNTFVDTHECPLCLSLDGMNISIDHPDFDRFIPPLHDGCRCIRVFIGNGETNVQFNWETPDEELIREHAPHLLLKK